MRLLDKVAQTITPIIVRTCDDGDVWQFPGADTLADEVRQCPLRYVLHDQVTEICTQLAFESDTVLKSSIALLRVPAPRLWLEFVGIARQKVFTNLGRADDDPNTCPQQRVGLLVTCDERGRKGSIHACWDGEDGDELDVAPFSIEFDFDDESFSKRGYSTAEDTSVGVNIGDCPELDALYNCVRFNLHPEWHRYYRARATTESHFRQILQDTLKPLLEDVPFLAAFCLLLISKGPLSLQPCDRSGINRQRTRRGRPPLLDHVELTMNLGEADRDRHNTDTHRFAPRLHFVRGHLVHRQGTIFWRTSHMRGKPEIGSIHTRTVSLRMAATGS